MRPLHFSPAPAMARSLRRRAKSWRPLGLGGAVGCRYQQTLNGSFSAVSKPIFASKYEILVLDEIYQICIPLHLPHLNNLAKFCHELLRFFHILQENSQNICNLRSDFCWNVTNFLSAWLSEFHKLSNTCWQFCCQMPETWSKSRKQLSRVRLEFDLSNSVRWS